MEHIQAGNTTFRGRSGTEYARIIAANKSWRFVGDQVVDDRGTPVSTTIEALADTAARLGWYDDAAVHWTLIPDAGIEAADAVRAAG
jgi:hypothetical protein